MQLKRLTEMLSVAGHIEPADLAALAARDFRSVINNRPDGEAAEQPASATMTAAAQHAGLHYRHIPVVSGQLQPAQVQAFAAALAALPGPVLAFCRSGTRSTMLWALQSDADAQAILQAALAAGYDLSVLRPQLRPAP